MAVIETWRRRDLNSLTQIEYLQGNLFSQDAAGNLIGVELYSGGEAYSGGGSISANVIRADGGTVAVTGSISGNKASVTLPAACYAVVGPIIIVVKLTVNSVVTTIGAFASSVYASTTGATVDPGTLVISVQTLITNLAAATASFADYSGLLAMIAPTYSTSGKYAVGDYVIYNNGLYRCTTAITSGESWTSGHWKAVTIGGEVSDLKSAITMRNKALADIVGFTAYENDYQTGAYTQSGPPVTANTGRAHCVYEGVSKGSKIYFDASKYLINYYYITSVSDYTNVHSPNTWDDTGEITLDYMDNGTVFVQVKRTGSAAYLADLLDDINASISVYRFNGTNFNYNGIVSGTTLAENNKIGIYAIGGSSTTVVSNMTDMPVSDFGGGYLMNTLIGSAGTTVQQTLVEYDSGSTIGRTFRRTVGGAWFGIGQYKWVAFGDSITHGSYSNSSGQTLNDSKHSYAFRIAKNVKRQYVSEFYNCAVRGIGWVNTGNNNETFADMMALFTGDKSSINLVTVMLGINDYISSETLGTTSSAENDGTISGAIRYGLKYICENYPNAKVIAISPLNSMNHGNASNGWSRNTRLTLPGTLQDVCDMIAYWCNVYGVRYINEISDSFINNYNISSYLKDNLHPTDDGQWMLAYEIAGKIF